MKKVEFSTKKHFFIKLQKKAKNAQKRGFLSQKRKKTTKNVNKLLRLLKTKIEFKSVLC